MKKIRGILLAVMLTIAGCTSTSPQKVSSTAVDWIKIIDEKNLVKAGAALGGQAGSWGSPLTAGQAYIPISSVSPTLPADTALPAADGSKFAVVKTFFATDRNFTNSDKPGRRFGNERAESITYGICNVSIPRDHRMGNLEAPSIWRLQFREDPKKHVVLLNTIPQSKDKFFSEMRDSIRSSKTSRAFVFIHGYRVTFEEAARRTAQMAYDLGFDGAPIFYSWPSQGEFAAYTVDEQNIEWAQSNIKAFLLDFLSRTSAENVYLVAHSMGNRALTRVLTSIYAEKPEVFGRLKEVILAAPDIDSAVFKRDIAPILTKTKSPITLYVSSTDKALAASKVLHKNPRLGDSAKEPVILPGIETIDATLVDSSFVGHSYIAERGSILSDIFYMINKHERASSRFGLRTIDVPSGRYWEFKP